MKNFVFIFMLFILNQNVSTYLGDSWRWSWRCNTKFAKCERFPQPLQENLQAEGKRTWSTAPEDFSQDVCRLTCGKFGALWPVPTISTQLSTKIIRFHPRDINFQISESTNEVSDYMREITKLFITNLDLECGDNCSVFPDNNVAISITINSKNTSLLPGIDESYNLQISTLENQVQVLIEAETVFGGRHGLETLTQLVASYDVSDSPTARRGLVMVAEVKIKDKPVYQHRGLLLDSARNFLPIESIKKQIKAMAASKMNVLHWHATDSQSFPVESKRIPQLSRFGAYSSKQIYKASEIRLLVSYAKLHGVRVIMEVDAPSHAGNGWQWGPTVGYGNLAVCINKTPWRQYCIQPPCGQLNPANNNVYFVLEELYKDILDMFNSGEYFHMGGDEVFIPCWNSTEEIISYMDEHYHGRNLEEFLQLWSDFHYKSLQMYDRAAGSSNKPVILWSSHLTNADIIERYLSKDRFIIETWVPSTDDLPERLLEKGYRLIIATKDAWYLDHGFWGNTQFHTWRIAYKNRLPKHGLVLGGEVCSWGELVDEASLDGRIWPRAAAAAERLWANPDLDTSAVEIRFYRHRQRLLTRGINAEALTPGWCYLNEGECQ